MQHVDAVCGFTLLLALFTSKLHAEDLEHGFPSLLVPHASQSGVEVDLRCQSADGQQAGVSDNCQGSYRLVKESRIHIGCLLQNQDIPTSSFCGSNLQIYEFCRSVNVIRIQTFR